MTINKMLQDYLHFENECVETYTEDLKQETNKEIKKIIKADIKMHKQNAKNIETIQELFRDIFECVLLLKVDGGNTKCIVRKMLERYIYDNTTD